METFLNRLNQTAQRMTTLERQKMLRTLVRQITVGKDLITIQHSIPVGVASGKPESASYPLCTRGPESGLSVPSRAGSLRWVYDPSWVTES